MRSSATLTSLLLLLISVPLFGQDQPKPAQLWVRSEYHDDLRNKSGVKFLLPAKEEGGGIGVICSEGKLQNAWLMTDKIADSDSGIVELVYRRDDEPKPHSLALSVSRNFHGVLLQEHHGHGGEMYGLEQLLYGPVFFGRGEWLRNKKANHYAHKLIVGLPEYLGSEVVYTFDVPDPSPMLQECGIH